MSVEMGRVRGRYHPITVRVSVSRGGVELGIWKDDAFGFGDSLSPAASRGLAALLERAADAHDLGRIPAEAEAEKKVAARAALAYITRDLSKGDSPGVINCKPQILCIWNPHYGCWALPGGREETSDNKSIRGALYRELVEELGVSPEMVGDLYDDAPSDTSRCSRVFIFHCTLNGEPSQQEPGAPIAWFTRAEFLRYTIFRPFYEKFFAVIDEKEKGG